MSMFHWIRDGVRRSVLLGVSDAVTQLGLPSDDEVHPQLSAMLGSAPAVNATLPALGSQGTSTRKRLGKSFQEIRQETEK